jgi:hypothetical protein
MADTFEGDGFRLSVRLHRTHAGHDDVECRGPMTATGSRRAMGLPRAGSILVSRHAVLARFRQTAARPPRGDPPNREPRVMTVSEGSCACPSRRPVLSVIFPSTLAATCSTSLRCDGYYLEHGGWRIGCLQCQQQSALRVGRSRLYEPAVGARRHIA